MNNYILSKGLKKATIAFLLFIVFDILDFELLSYLFLFFTFSLLYIYRNPKPSFLASKSEDIIKAECDAKVTDITQIGDETYGFVVEMESNCFTKAILYPPFKSKVEDIKLQRGSRVVKHSRLFDKLNERLEVVFKNEKASIKVVHTLKRTPESIEVFVKTSQEVEPNKPYGYAINAVTKIYLPKEVDLRISVSDKLSAGETIIGYIK
jgi:hypothetical protein